MLVVIVLSGIKAQFFNDTNIIDEKLISDGESELNSRLSKSNMDTKKNQTTNETNTDNVMSMSLRYYDFMVSEAEILNQWEGKDVVPEGSSLVIINLRIKNNSGEVQSQSLNSHILKITDSNTKKIIEIPLSYVDEPVERINSSTYFHCDISSNEMKTIKLFYIVDSDLLTHWKTAIIHFNPFGTEGAVMKGKTADGKVVELYDTENVADIDITPLLNKEE